VHTFEGRVYMYDGGYREGGLRCLLSHYEYTVTSQREFGLCQCTFFQGNDDLEQWDHGSSGLGSEERNKSSEINNLELWPCPITRMPTSKRNSLSTLKQNSIIFCLDPLQTRPVFLSLFQNSTLYNTSQREK
jgi:hypothetical protein